MFWIALELSNPMVGLITRLSLQLKNITAFKFGEVAKSGNARLSSAKVTYLWRKHEEASALRTSLGNF